MTTVTAGWFLVRDPTTTNHYRAEPRKTDYSWPPEAGAILRRRQPHTVLKSRSKRLGAAESGAVAISFMLSVVVCSRRHALARGATEQCHERQPGMALQHAAQVLGRDAEIVRDGADLQRGLDIAVLDDVHRANTRGLMRMAARRPVPVSYREHDASQPDEAIGRITSRSIHRAQLAGFEAEGRRARPVTITGT